MIPVLSFGSTPPANAFLHPEELGLNEPRYPLDLHLCGECGWAQLRHIVSRERLFRNYVYVSSTSPTFVSHFSGLAAHLAERFDLRPADLAVDIGSNDGILLRPLRSLGLRVLGVDPASNIAQAATQAGIETRPEFLSPKVAGEIVRRHGRARMVTAANLFAHVDDLDEFLESVKLLLSPDGLFVVEVPYLVDLLEKNLFDTIYHEHLSYISVRPLLRLLDRLGMELFDVQRVESHGGSLRAFLQVKGGSHPSNNTGADLLEEERLKAVHDPGTFQSFRDRIEKNKAGLREMLGRLKDQGRRIAGYGAPAKANTLLNLFGIGRETLAYIVDDNPRKQGLYTPGTRIEVAPPERIEADPPDAVLILAWNFAESIRAKLAPFEARGGRLILPCPTPRLL